MNGFTVVWEPGFLDELVDVWVSSSPDLRRIVTRLANHIDATLQSGISGSRDQVERSQYQWEFRLEDLIATVTYRVDSVNRIIQITTIRFGRFN